MIDDTFLDYSIKNSLFCKWLSWQCHVYQIVNKIFVVFFKKKKKKIALTFHNMSCSINSPMSILDEDKYNSERLLALKYIKDRIGSATILNVLAPITPQDEYIFDAARVNDQSSDVSELSDPFAELGGNIILSAENKQKRRLSKVEADVLVMNSFPATHMEIQNEIISEMNLIIPPQLDIKKIMEVNSDEEEDPESAEVMQSVEASLEQCGLKVYREEKKKRDEKQSQQQKQRQKKVKTQDELDIETNSLSGIWRMLGTKMKS